MPDIKSAGGYVLTEGGWVLAEKVQAEKTAAKKAKTVEKVGAKKKATSKAVEKEALDGA